MTFVLPRCARCGHTVFPPRALCPSCGAAAWVPVAAATGIVEVVSEHRGAYVCAVRTDTGPVLVARASARVATGETVSLTTHDGVAVVEST